MKSARCSRLMVVEIAHLVLTRVTDIKQQEVGLPGK